MKKPAGSNCVQRLKPLKTCNFVRKRLKLLINANKPKSLILDFVSFLFAVCKTVRLWRNSLEFSLCNSFEQNCWVVFLKMPISIRKKIVRNLLDRYL
jgi:hypothetical protein